MVLYLLLVTTAAILLVTTITFTILFIVWKYQVHFYRLYCPRKNVSCQYLRSLADDYITIQSGQKSNVTLYIKNAQAPKAVILYLHGNRADFATDYDFIKSLVSRDFTVICLEYRGYGGNSGIPSEYGLKSDAAKAIRVIKNDDHYENLPLVICGMSIGAALTFHMMEHGGDCLKGVIIINCFTTLKQISGWKLYRRFRWLTLFLNEKWDNMYHMMQYGKKYPALFISSTGDNLIPPCMMGYMYNLYPCLLKYYYPIPGGHNSFFKKSIRKEIIDRISSFVKEVSLCKRDDDKDEDEDEDML